LGCEQLLKSFCFPPGRRYDGIPVTLVSSWHSKKANRPLEVTIGKHTVRVAFIADPREKDGKPLRAVSNPVPEQDTSARDLDKKSSWYFPEMQKAAK